MPNSIRRSAISFAPYENSYIYYSLFVLGYFPLFDLLKRDLAIDYLIRSIAV